MKRWQRNLGTITNEEQLIINNAKVLIIGLGGLGSHVLEGISRLGVQEIGICDHDVVETTNLNRQLLSLPNNIGIQKRILAYNRIRDIDRQIKINVYDNNYPHKKIVNDLAYYDIVFDCLDNNESRLILENDVININKVLVYGAIAGNYGYFGISSKDNQIIKHHNSYNKGLETRLNNPYYTPAIIANMQIILGLKYLLKKDYLNNGFYAIDLDDLSIDKIITK